MSIDIKMEFEKWVEMIHDDHSKPDGRQIADITAQMLGRIVNGCYHINFSGVRVVFKSVDTTGVPELVFTDMREYTAADAVFLPIGYKGEARTNANSADAVFVVGLLLYYMVTGEKPDVSDVEFTRNGSAVQVDNSRFNECIRRMTDTNENNRITADGAIKLLNKMYPSEAVIRFKDKDSGIDLYSERIPVEEAVAYYNSNSGDRYFRGRQYFTEGGVLKIPYRTYVKDYIVNCTFFRSGAERRVNVEAKGVKYGIDIGSCFTCIMKFEGGRLSSVGELCMPTMKQYGNKQFYFFSSENKIEDVKSEKGELRLIKREEAASEFTEGILDMCDAGVGEATVTCTRDFRELLAETTEKYNTLKFISPLKAMGIAFMHENDFTGKALLIDAGNSNTRICVLDTGKNISEAEWKGEIYVSGGKDVRESVMKNVLSIVEKSYGVSMWKQSSSGLDEAKFAENRKVLEDITTKLYNRATIAKNRNELFFEAELWSSTGKQRIRISCRDVNVTAQYGYLGVKINEGIEKCIANSGVRKNDIRCIVVTGRTALIPEVNAVITKAAEMFSIQVTDFVWDVSLKARGAAIYAAVMDGSSDKLPDEYLEYDIGIMSCSVISSIPVFKCIAESGTAYSDDILRVSYDAAAEKDEIEDGVYVLKIYKRDADKKDVSSTFDINGSAIKYTGEVRVTMPLKYRYDTDVLHFEFTLHESGKMDVCVSHRRKSARIMKLINTLSGELATNYSVINENLRAEYRPKISRK